MLNIDPRLSIATGAEDLMNSPLEEFQTKARAWLESELPPRRGWSIDTWDVTNDAVPVFNNLPSEQDTFRLLKAGAQWQAKRYEAGYAGITLPMELGGQGLGVEYVRAYHEVESQFEVPQWDELLEVTIDLAVPTLFHHASQLLLDRYLISLLRADTLCTQLFSEPGAGSDLASLTTSAIQTSDGWRINGQKIWSSGASHADVGLLLARTDRNVAKHKGLTAFLIPLDKPGIDVRPIRQMTGGTSFCEVFLTDVELSDEYRIGEPGQGWAIAMTTLKFERDNSAITGGEGLEQKFQKVRALAAFRGVLCDPIVQQAIGDLYVQIRTVSLVAQRNQETLEGGLAPGPEGSLGKLMWSQTLQQMSDVVTLILELDIVVDSGDWGAFSWSQHVLGAPGFRIAGGSDEIQRTIIADRVLGLPKGN